MKTVLFAMITLATSVAARADHTALEINPDGQMRVDAHYSSAGELGKRLLDVLSKTPVLKAENNAWIEPNTFFRSADGNVSMRIDNTSNKIILSLIVKGGESFTQAVGKTVQIRGGQRGSAVEVLQQALLQSKSDKVITMSKPGKRISFGSSPGRAAVLSDDIFVGSLVVCDNQFDSTKVFCEIVAQ